MRYQGTQNEIGYDGLWHTSDFYSDDTYIVIETKKTTAYTIDPRRQPREYMDALLDAEDTDANNIYGLIVVGKTDLRSIVQAIRGSEYRDRIRVISCSRLFDLLEMLEHTSLQPKQAADLLLPMDAVDIGSLVELITDVVQSSTPSSPEHLGRDETG